MHWDHADGVDLFPKAQVWIQKDEYDNSAGADRKLAANDDGNLPAHYVAPGQAQQRRPCSPGRRRCQGNRPGVTVYTGGKHTVGSQYVGVKTKAGLMIIASDNVYLYENLDKHVPIAQTVDAEVKPGGAGPDEETRLEPPAHHPEPRPGGLRPLPEAGEWRGAVGLRRHESRSCNARGDVDGCRF